MDKVLVLRNTKKGLTVDTVYNSQDTIVVQLKNETTVSIPNNKIKVDLPEKADLDVITSLAIIIGGLAGLAGAIVAFWQLFKRDKNKENQIAELIKQTTEFSKQTSELIKQTKLNEKRIRMLVKPRIWSKLIANVRDEIHMSLNNRGELCFYDDYEILQGDSVAFERFDIPYKIKKDELIYLIAPQLEKLVDELQFKIKIYYHDQEEFKYETIIEWDKSVFKHIETLEV